VATLDLKADMEGDFSSDGISIRRYQVTDIPLLHEAVRESISEISPWMPWCHPDYSMEDSAAWVLSRDEAWANEVEHSFVITDAETGAFLGAVGLNQFNRDHQFANLGYWVRSSRAGRGVATTATLLTARFGLRKLALQRIEILAAVGNKPSQRVAEKAGAKNEGVLRNRLSLRGQPHDAVMYSLIPSDPNVSQKLLKKLPW
jgi:RimJ/RimL family protein N-acetyltransferase